MTRPDRHPPLAMRLARTLALGLLLGWTVAHARELQINYPVTPFKILETGGEIGTRFDYLSEKQGSNGESSKFSNQTFQEYLEYWLHGYAYHPRFLEFRTKFEVGLLQQVIDRQGIGEDDGSLHENATLYGYDVNLLFFKEHPYTFQAFASQDREPVLELFTDLQMIESERYGGVLNIKRGPFPMDFSYTDAKSREFGADSHSDSQNRTFEYIVRNYFREKMYSELRYRHNEYEQNFRADTGYFDVRRRTQLTSDEIQFLNTIYLNQERSSSLGTTLRMFKESGTQEFKNYFWQERLNLRHTPNFSTYYVASLLKNQYRRADVQTLRGEAGLEHRLFRSLQSHFDVHGRQTEYGDTNEDVYGVTGRLAYRKQTPWGQLTSGYGRTLDQVTRTGEGGRQSIIDEKHTLTSKQLTYLSQNNIKVDSIQVTDDQGQDTYDEGFDYEVREVGDRVGLRLLGGGRLSDGDSVLVDYDTEIDRDLSYLSDLQTANLGFDFEKYVKGLSLYYRWQDLAAREMSGSSDNSILAFNDNIYGMTYRFLCFTWLEEYEQYRSDSSSYDQLRSELEAFRQLGRHMRLGWNAGMTKAQYLDDSPEDQSKTVYTGLTLDGHINSHLQWHLESGLRHETGLTDEDLLGASGKLTYQLRQLKIETGARLEQRERFDTSRDRMLYFLQISRQFGRRSARP